MIGQRLGSYEIIEEAGKGGMATVYRAYQSSIDRYVAIKVIQKGIASSLDAVERFQREARLVARLEHPHILPVYDFDGTNDPPYIVMRYLESGTLRDVLQLRRLPMSEVGYLIRQIASALDYAHRQGVVHRDIKPSNIMIDREGNAFVTDFGIARMVHDSGDRRNLTQEGAAVGTPDYMSPEQGMGMNTIDHRADIYALGVMAFQLVTGSLPYKADNPIGVIVKHVKDPVPTASGFSPSVTEIVDEVLRRAMDKKPDRRYPNTTDFALELSDALGETSMGAPVTLRQAAAESVEHLIRYRANNQPLPDGATVQTDGTPEQISEMPTVTADAEMSAGMSRTGRKSSDTTDSSLTEHSKVLTSMVVYGVEYAELIEELDGPEAAFNALNNLWETIKPVIAGHGGVVFEHEEGDLLALWGAEAVQEDDPERAIQAGLAIMQLLQQPGKLALPEDEPIEPLPVGIGVNTGAVLLTPRTETSEYNAIGANITLTARLAQNAYGRLLITKDTYQYVRGLFETIPDEPIRGRGRREKLPVFRVTAAKDRAHRLNVRGVEGVETRTIGRDAELKHLQDAFFAAAEDQETQVVTIIGEAGMGKSRLLYEFMNRAEMQPDPFEYWAGRATPGMRSQPYALLRRMVSHLFEIFDSDDPEVVHRKLVEGIAEIVEFESREMALYVGTLLGFDLSNIDTGMGLMTDPVQVVERGREMFIRMLAAYSTNHTVVIALEDMHWADDPSLDILNELVSEHQELSLLMMCLVRPEFENRRPTWGSGQNFHTRLELRALSKRDTRNLVREILKKLNEPPPRQLTDMILERTEGNPFYIEEIIKMLIEDRIIKKEGAVWLLETERLENTRVPPTLIGLLQTRLDSLLYTERLVLQRASVIGRIFWDGALVALNEADEFDLYELDEILERLDEHEFIHILENTQFEDNTAYIFNHAMMRDVIYENLLRSQQRAYHVRMAEWLVEQSGRSAEYTALIAEHYHHAGEVERAIQYLEQGGETAMETGAFQDAISLYRQALEIVSVTKDPARRALLLTRQGEVYKHLGDYEHARQQIESALPLIEGDTHRRVRADVLSTLGAVAIRQGDRERARESLEAALEIAAELDSQETHADVLIRLATLDCQLGLSDEAITHAGNALSLYELLNDHYGMARSLEVIGDASLDKDDVDSARENLQRSLDIAREIDARQMVSSILLNLGDIARRVDDYAQARAHYEESLRISVQINARNHTAQNHLNLGVLALLQENIAEGRRRVRDALQIALESGAQPVIVQAVAALAHLRMLENNSEGALELIGLVRALETTDPRVEQIIAPVMQRLKAAHPDEAVQAALARGREMELLPTADQLLAQY